jgi:hypothetical protein
MIFTPAQTKVIFNAITETEASNNGWSFIASHDWLHAALQAAGYTVIRSTDYSGRPAFKAYTRAAQSALRGQPYAVSNYATVQQLHAEPDYEAAILARQEAATMDF